MTYFVPASWTQLVITPPFPGVGWGKLRSEIGCSFLCADGGRTARGISGARTPDHRTCDSTEAEPTETAPEGSHVRELLSLPSALSANIPETPASHGISVGRGGEDR